VDPKLIEMADKQVRQKIIEQMEEGLL